MPNNSCSTDPKEQVTRISQHGLSELLLMLFLKPHRLLIAFWWRILGKKVRARGLFDRGVAGLPFAMERTIDRCEVKDLATLAEIRGSGIEVRICVHLHIAKDTTPSWTAKALKAVARQSFAPFRVFITRDENAASNVTEGDLYTVLPQTYASRVDGLEAALIEAKKMGAHWLVPCAPGSVLTSSALAAFSAHASSLIDGNLIHVIYGDTREQPEGALGVMRRTYWLKPKWDPRMFLSQDYVTHGCALAIQPSLDALKAASTPSPKDLFGLVLRLSENEAVEHCDRVVSQSAPKTWCTADVQRLASIRSSIGERGCAEDGPYGTTQVRWSLPKVLPKVSVIVATRDKVDLLRTCVEGVLEGTDYGELDLIIADNDSVDPETLSYLDAVSLDPKVQVVRWPHPFNYSAINNFAARHAKGEYLCLLNNDIEVMEPDWLIEMMREAVQPGIGAVGARLLYPDRSIQHAGVAIGIGNAAGHAHRGLVEGEPGYFAQALIARGASAVTAACLLVKKEHFDAVGGLDEEHLAIAYNDVDLCLKLQACGLKNIYTPLATLIHHESKSRGLDFAPENLERYMRELKVFQECWDTKKIVDPWHHSNLSRNHEVYAI